MSWWWWVLLWLGLALAALGFFFLLGRQLWRQLRLLVRELSTAADRLSAVTAELDRLQERTQDEPEAAAVFADPTSLRAQRFAARTKHRGSGRRTPT